MCWSALSPSPCPRSHHHKDKREKNRVALKKIFSPLLFSHVCIGISHLKTFTNLLGALNFVLSVLSTSFIPINNTFLKTCFLGFSSSYINNTNKPSEQSVLLLAILTPTYLPTRPTFSLSATGAPGPSRKFNFTITFSFSPKTVAPTPLQGWKKIYK